MANRRRWSWTARRLDFPINSARAPVIHRLHDNGVITILGANQTNVGPDRDVGVRLSADRSVRHGGLSFSGCVSS